MKFVETPGQTLLYTGQLSNFENFPRHLPLALQTTDEFFISWKVHPMPPNGPVHQFCWLLTLPYRLKNDENVPKIL